MAANRKTRRELGVDENELSLEFDLDDFDLQALEVLGQIPGLTLNLKNGTSVTIVHPIMVSDERNDVIEAVQTGKDLDHEEVDELNPETGEKTGKKVTKILDTIDGEPAESHSIRFAKAILGEEDHAKFLAGGGSSARVALAWQYMTGRLKDPKSEK